MDLLKKWCMFRDPTGVIYIDDISGSHMDNWVSYPLYYCSQFAIPIAVYRGDEDQVWLKIHGHNYQTAPLTRHNYQKVLTELTTICGRLERITGELQKAGVSWKRHNLYSHFIPSVKKVVRIRADGNIEYHENNYSTVSQLVDECPELISKSSYCVIN